MTCDFCLDGRHVRCRPTTNGCTCLRCASERPKMPKAEPRTPRVKREPGEPRERRADGKRGKPLGFSSLPPDVQQDIEAELAAGANLSFLSRKHGVSRDKVRTIRRRMERANG